MEGMMAYRLLLVVGVWGRYVQPNTETPTLIEYLQVDDMDSGKYDDVNDRPKNSCTRPCLAGSTRTCYYKFTLQSYVTMGKACGNCLTNITDCYKDYCVTADGYERGALTINRRLPAPSIQVCEGDLVIVDVKNAMHARSTTIHWHGLRQVNSKHMDGVPMVTQCPILENQIFRYYFIADKAGLYFYHSHDGLQKMDGIVGSFVVRQPVKEDPNRDLYDFDCPSHVILIQDWYHMMADTMFPGLRYRDAGQIAISYLIQGRGQYIMKDGYRLANTPITVLKVKQYYRYLLRIVAGTCFECQYTLTIEQHNMTIIGADGISTKPYVVNSLTMSPGERFSVVINCNRPLRSYWIQVRARGLCESLEANQVAVLRYEGADSNPTTSPPTYSLSKTNNPGLTMNPLNSHCTEETKLTDGPCIYHLRSSNTAPDEIRKLKPYMRIVWMFGFIYLKDHVVYTSEFPEHIQTPFGPLGSTINGVDNILGPVPMLSQYEDVPSNLWCPDTGFEPSTWNIEHRECIHVFKVPVKQTIEILVLDNDVYDAAGISHAIHLHGYNMYILEMGVLNQNLTYEERVKEILNYLESDQRKEIPKDCISKDTFPLPAGGWAIIRIFTDNPGVWFFHCHFSYHLDSGMSGILQVGEKNDWPTPPPNFPRCGDFLPKLQDINKNKDAAKSSY